MTEREYQYFMMISEKCSDKGKVTKGKPASNNEYPHFNSPSKTTNFNRRKITIKTDKKTYGGGIGVEVIDGVYVGGTQSKLETRWVAYEGFNPTSLVKFFEITGYNKEANRYRNLYAPKKYNKGWQGGNKKKQDIAGIALAGLGFNAFAVAIGDEGFFYRVSAIIWIGAGVVLMIDNSIDPLPSSPPTPPIGMFSTRPNNVLPLQKAIEMAEGYNYQLWKKLK